MAWDPALLRKYNTTSHFRLLNQIRSELREQPIQRPLVTSRSAAAAMGGSRRGARSKPSEETQPQISSPAQPQGTTRRRSAASAPLPMAAVADLQQPIVAVPVITDLVLPDSHTGV